MSHSEFLERRGEAIPRGPFQVTPIAVSRAQGTQIWDLDGREYLDFCGGIGTLNVGHNHPRVVDAIIKQVQKYIHTCWHVVMYEPYLELAERLNQLVPILGPNKTVFFNSGAEAVENAVKIARAATKRTAVIAFERGFHGRTLLAMTLTSKVQPYSAGFGPFAPEVYRLPFKPFYASESQRRTDVEEEAKAAVKRLFSYHIDSKSIAAIIFEPVLGEGGFLPINRYALTYLREVCRQQGILLIADEVQTGFGRCGAMFAIQKYEIEPDMMVMAKSLAGGLPLSAVTGKAAIMDAPQVGGIGGTFGGNPVSCAAALAVLDVIEEENLCERAEILGLKVEKRFKTLSQSCGFLSRPRRLGAMCAFDVVGALGEPDAKLGSHLIHAAREEGLLLMTASGYVIRLLMPLTTTDEELEEGLNRFERAAKKVNNYVSNA